PYYPRISHRWETIQGRDFKRRLVEWRMYVVECCKQPLKHRAAL
ncbi:hypothetical protein LSH36_269g06054, partial [Paralvinella palmiformis]